MSAYVNCTRTCSYVVFTGALSPLSIQGLEGELQLQENLLDRIWFRGAFQLSATGSVRAVVRHCERFSLKKMEIRAEVPAQDRTAYYQDYLAQCMLAIKEDG